MFEDALQAAQALAGSVTWTILAKRAMTAIAIVACALLVVKMLRYSLDRVRGRVTNGAPMVYIVEQLATYLIMIVGVLAGVTALGIDITSLSIFAGAIGVGLGLGLQGIVKEFVSGLVLIFDPTIRIGDFIELEGEVRGEVVEIGPRATRLRTNDNLNVVIPNSALVQSQVRNWTYNESSRRIHVPFSVAKQSDCTKVRDVVLAAARGLDFTLPDDDLHKAQVWLKGFSGAGLDFDLVIWPTPASARHPRTLHAAYTWAIYEALRAEGINSASDQLEISLRGLFGLEGDDALKVIHVPTVDEAQSRPRKEHETAPNDAATAVALDSDRGLHERAIEQPRHR
ncbi:Mechanosensitive ion channel [Sphingomonas laterariae]|uniref:Mechanosensitive ion channel n=1 Tax=Edaphosphingomonas laterariae TaxID=861865 RepID=A0A239G889_9SPHN|nr:mechanosensitive ion channel domain-containing protein [Sphingomonas laterariae]SNS64673.1 Mechanosensitive ion channel [Sphingomonas laterariae]